MTEPNSLSRASSHAAVQPVDPAERLLIRWQQGERVDVDTFLESTGQLSAGQLAAVLRLDQHRRWHSDDRFPVERYFERYPQLDADAEAAVDMIFHEFLLRERLGECPESGEYADRFPAYAGPLRDQIALHRALEDTDFARAATLSQALTAAQDTPAANQPPHTPSDLVIREGLSSQWEIRPLLRKRLRLISVLNSAVIVLGLPAWWPLLVSPGQILMYSTVAVGSCALAVLLWSSRPISLPVLRWIEAGLFGELALYFGWQDYWFFQSGWFATLASYHLPGVVTAVRSQSGQWALLIILYGILIPNTARRALAAVTLLALVRLAILGGIVLTVGAVANADTVNFFLISVLGMFVVGAIAVFGAHRIESLRHTASEARKLGPYRLIKRLGAGGMGQVYLAEHALLRRPCALKLIRPEQVGDPRFLARFEREVQTLATLTHPNTVRVYDYGLAADGTFYYAMEYLPGWSLEALVARDGPLPAARAVYLLRQVCGALREAHAAGLVHRDIKPANILAGETGGMHDVVKLLDFGLVHFVVPSANVNLTGIGTIVGTPAFMSPEQAAGTADVDARSDIYSLGAVAYFLVTGQAPFVRSTSVETMAAHVAEQVVAPSLLRPEIPDDLEGVILRCLAKAPQRRFPDVAAMEQALARCACRDDWSAEQAADWWRTEQIAPIP